MLDRQIGLTGEQAQPAAPIPAVGKARIECESTINHGEGGIDILAEAPEHHGGAAEDARVIGGGAQGLAGKINRRAAIFVLIAIISPIVVFEVDPVGRRQRESRTVARFAIDCLLEEIERLSEVLPLVARSSRARPQIKIVSS